MESKADVLERFMRDQEHKAKSLYDKGYEKGFAEGYGEGYEDGKDAIESKEDTIHVGDEVIDPNGLRAIVTNTDTHHHLFYPENGKTWKAPKSIKLKKTGVEITV